MKSFLLSDVDCPQVMFEVGGEQIESTIIPSAKKTPNFDRPLMFLDVVRRDSSSMHVHRILLLVDLDVAER